MSNKISFTAAEQYGIMLDTDEDRLLDSTQRFACSSFSFSLSALGPRGRVLLISPAVRVSHTGTCGRTQCRSHMEVESWLEWKTIRRRMPYYMPILLWLPKYNWRESLIYDLFAGVAVAAMIIPQVRSSLQRTHTGNAS
jgi:hypothetical protein